MCIICSMFFFSITQKVESLAWKCQSCLWNRVVDLQSFRLALQGVVQSWFCRYGLFQGFWLSFSRILKAKFLFTAMRKYTYVSFLSGSSHNFGPFTCLFFYKGKVLNFWIYQQFDPILTFAVFCLFFGAQYNLFRSLVLIDCGNFQFFIENKWEMEYINVYQIHFSLDFHHREFLPFLFLMPLCLTKLPPMCKL